MSHVLDKFQVLPRLRFSQLRNQQHQEQEMQRLRILYYLNPSSATVALILNEKEELLVVRRRRPSQGACSICQAVLSIWTKQVKKAWQER